MLTLNDVLTHSEFWHNTLKNADGTPLRCRKNGAVKTWKTRPGEWLVPVKHGQRDYFYISSRAGLTPPGKTGDTPHVWCVPERWDAEHVLFEGVKP